MTALADVDVVIGKKGKIINSQARQIVANVLNFMKREAENDEPLIPLTSYKSRLLAATKVSENTYKSIIKEQQQIESGVSLGFKSPQKKRPRSSPKKLLQPGEKNILKRVIHNFYLTEKCRPTLKSIYAKLKECDLSFTGGLSTLRSVIKDMGFKWKSSADNRKVLVKTHKICFKRNTYLRQLRQCKNEGRPIIYCDESYIYSSHTKSKACTDNSLLGLKKPVEKGQHLIMIHAGGANGFISNALLMFQFGVKSGDYHDDMNSTNFLKWVKNQLIPNLPDKCVLVIDNASYHNNTLDKHPTSGSLKNDMITWLRERSIPFDPDLIKQNCTSFLKSINLTTTDLH